MAKTDKTENGNVQQEFKKVEEKKPKLEREEKKSKKNFYLKVVLWLQERYEFRYNLFTQRTEMRPLQENVFKVIDKWHMDNLLAELKMDAGLNITITDFDILLGSKKLCYEYDPIKEYLYSLPKWDGVDRFPEFLRCVQLKDESLNRKRFINYFQRWFTSYVASVVDNDLYNEVCLILTGGQGDGKTRFLRTLVPSELRFRYYFEGDYDFNDKDHREYMGTKILINLDEMSHLTRTDTAKLKSVLSTKSFEVRRPYGRQSVFYYRKASFCGTTNEDQFLTDQTGNRRWLPFYVENITIDEDYPISLLYAQALAQYKQGIKTYFDKEELTELMHYIDQFRRRPIEEELILENLKKPTTKDFEDNSVEWLQTSYVDAYLKSDEAFKKVNVNETTIKKTGMALKALGFEQKSKLLEGRTSPVYCWAVVKIRGIDRAASDIRRNNTFNDRDNNDMFPI